LEPEAWHFGRAWVDRDLHRYYEHYSLPDGWAHEAGGFPIMTLPLGFLMKDVLFLVASFYLLKQDLRRAALEITRTTT